MCVCVWKCVQSSYRCNTCVFLTCLALYWHVIIIMVVNYFLSQLGVAGTSFRETSWRWSLLLNIEPWERWAKKDPKSQYFCPKVSDHQCSIFSICSTIWTGFSKAVLDALRVSRMGSSLVRCDLVLVVFEKVGYTKAGDNKSTADMVRIKGLDDLRWFTIFTAIHP